MSAKYVMVQWNSHKRRYDMALALGILLYVAFYISASRFLWRGDHAIDPPILLIRATGTCAIILLNIVLCIGPLARIDRRFAAVLYNRRHLGVVTFCIAAVHGIVVLGYYHGFGKLNPLISLLTFDNSWRGDGSAPFQILGAVALLILFIMAATSHDFWLKNLSPRMWKWLHMLVYLAYGLVVPHVAMGALHSETNPIYAVMLLAGAAIISMLHIFAAFKQNAADARESRVKQEWIDVCAVADIKEKRSRGILIGSDPVAVFKYDGKLSAVAGACEHQGGPLAEGKIVGGCITCPWHGYQYQPADGCSPPPFTEKLCTYQVRVRAGRVEVNVRKLPPGTAIEPASIHAEAADAEK